MAKIKTKSYTLRTENGTWLAQILLSSDGMFSSVTDYGNLSFAWRSAGDDFRQFLSDINVDYFATKLFSGMSYILHTRATELKCKKFAEMILPPLQQILKQELANGIGWEDNEEPNHFRDSLNSLVAGLLMAQQMGLVNPDSNVVNHLITEAQTALSK